jgi:Fur family ferric uptake transcriptional regulator
MAADDRLLTVLGGRRLTGSRRVIADLIARREGHFTAADLAADAREQRVGLGRATIFRSLELLTELGLVERVDLPSGEHAYVRCAPTHHHHVICSSCGRTEVVPHDGVERFAREAEARTGFRIDDHRLELWGRCPGCTRGAAEALDRARR